jgi:hypothetical protein
MLTNIGLVILNMYNIFVVNSNRHIECHEIEGEIIIWLSPFAHALLLAL